MVEVEPVTARGCEPAGGEFGGGGDVERGVVRNVGAVGVDEGVLPRADQDQVPQPGVEIPRRNASAWASPQRAGP